jgi:hypothetical protein
MNRELKATKRDLLTNVLPTLQTGDIILTSYRSFISRVMQIFSRNDKVNWGHCLIVKDNTTAWEAHFTIQESNIEEVLRRKKYWKIAHKKDITEEQRKEIFEVIKPLIGRDYGYFRLFLFLLDGIFNTNLFTTADYHEHTQVCSSLIAWVYNKCCGYKFNKQDWSSCDPDDYEDDWEKNPNTWEIISEYKP